MAVGDFDTYYPQNPWASITSKERVWYVPELYGVYRRSAIYNSFVQTEFNLNGPKATEMYLTSMLASHSNFDPIGLRALWTNAAYQDFFKRKLTFNRYGGKFSVNRYDDHVSYYLKDGVGGLRKIIQDEIGPNMTRTLDKLARNAFMAAPFAMYGTSTGVNFGDITTSDKITTQIIEDMILGMKERDISAVTTGDGSPGALVCVTSPGVLYDLRNEITQQGNAAGWQDVHTYTQGQARINGEVGSYHGIRFIEHNDAVLYNVGEWDGVGAQTTITAAIAAGDGSPNPSSTAVDTLEYVGQVGATHSIAVASSTGIVAGDFVSIHVDRTSDFGVTNGADFRDGKKTERRVVSVPDSTHLVFDRPIMEDFSLDLGGGVYGYVTKARNIHSALFLASRDGVVMGVSEAPKMHYPAPVDDFDMIYRFTWDAYLGYQAFNKNAFETLFLAGSNRMLGPRYLR